MAEYVVHFTRDQTWVYGLDVRRSSWICQVATGREMMGAVTYTVSYRLQRLGISGVLVRMAESGAISELRCQMLTCYCPGGRGYFDTTSSASNDWVPNPDHYPLSKANGGHLVPENVRLAHTLCNRLASPEHATARREADDLLVKRDADHPGKKKKAIEGLWAEKRKATKDGRGSEYS